MLPVYDINKIKFSTDQPTFEKAVALYENGKVMQFEDGAGGFSAIVMGSEPYHVFVDARHYNRGYCDCYLGQNDTLCKHMVAVAIHAVMMGQPLGDEDKEYISCPQCSGRLQELSKEDLSMIRKSITSAMRYIKAYDGPSKTWFAYQNSLAEGCNRLSFLISKLPINKKTTALLVDMLLRLDKKLCQGGVDDSDGTVGNFIYETVNVLKEYVRLSPLCITALGALKNVKTCFGWEEELLKLMR